MVKSLHAQEHALSYADNQLRLLEGVPGKTPGFTAFKKKLDGNGLFPLKPTGIDILQVNVGKMCNQTCKHCHVDAGPDRKEIMTRETMEQVLRVLKEADISTLDLTGGAPELNPHFRWLVEEAAALGVHVIDRCNLTILLANKRFHDLPQFLAQHRVEVVSSLPHFSRRRTDSQRGEGVFDKSVRALEMLNEAGYGMEGTGLELNLVYNPAGAFLPASQESLEAQFKEQLQRQFGIRFNHLFTITNLPISRFLDYLLASGNYEEYMEKLVDSFNPAAARAVMCRNTLSVGWDGRLYDCDFNQMLELPVQTQAPQHIRDFDLQALNDREIVINQHCYGCTAGAGSSCGGATT